MQSEPVRTARRGLKTITNQTQHRRFYGCFSTAEPDFAEK